MERRVRQFTPFQRLETLERQGYACAGCCETLVSGRTDFDHRVPWAVSRDSSSANCQALCSACHAFKTRKFDQGRIREVKKLAASLTGASETVCYWCKDVLSQFFAGNHACIGQQEVWNRMREEQERGAQRANVHWALEQFRRKG